MGFLFESQIFLLPIKYQWARCVSSLPHFAFVVVITGVRWSLLYSRRDYIISGIVSDPYLVHRDLQMILCSIIIWNVRQNWTRYEIQVTQTGLTKYERNKREETHIGVQADRTRHEGMRTQYNIMKPHLLVLKVLSADCVFRDHSSVVGASYPAFCDQLLLPSTERSSFMYTDLSPSLTNYWSHWTLK